MSHLPPVEPTTEILSGVIVTVPDSDEVLEGEIIETYSEAPLEQSALNLATNLVWDSQQQSESLASWLLLQENATFGTDYISPLKNSLAVFLTPCRLGAMGVLLLANFLLAWNQLSSPKPVANLQAQTATFVAPPAQPQTRENPHRWDLAAEKSELAFSSLSTATPAAQPAVSATVGLAGPQTAPLETTATPSLSNALLPYSPTQLAQPLQSYPSAPVKAAPPPKAPTVQYVSVPAYVLQPVQPPQSSFPTEPVKVGLPTAPVAQYSPAPALPSVQQPPAVQPSSPPTPQDLGKQSIIRQDLDRLRLESENPPPLGFNQEYRIKIQSYQTQTNPNQLRQQLQQLQQQATPTKLK